VVKEFEQLAHDRARGRTGYQDASPEWQATSAKLRKMIDEYNRAPPEVQDEIRKRLSTTPVLAQSLEQVLKQRRELDRDLDQDLSL
jgi:hypothetical protein